MRAPTPNPHPVGTPEWVAHEDAWFREFHASGELHHFMATIGHVGALYDERPPGAFEVPLGPKLPPR